MNEYRKVFDAWVRRHVDDAPFHKHGEGSDYPEHHLTVDSTPEQDADLQAGVDDLIRSWPEKWEEIRHRWESLPA